MLRDIPFDTAVNLRPIEYLVTRCHKAGIQLFRSATPTSYSDRDWEVLSTAHEVVALLDLRDPFEVQREPIRYRALQAGIECHHFPLTIDNPNIRNQRTPDASDYADYYLCILETCRQPIAHLLQWMAYELRGSTVISCFAGKDRTGVIIYLLLSILDAPWLAIQEDYVLSTAYLTRQLDYYSNRWLTKGLSRYEFSLRMTARSETINIFHKGVNDRYGGVACYLATIDVDLNMIERIKSRILTNQDKLA